ncbi:MULTISPECIES: TRAP transporter small permease subunit [unclassified Meridianimarinicoccus]|uniref:TRAP transporter small permease subunit n=1 Tax=unclassified Meridianimarinicoccus TaxID=2923344 RepID=UPI0018669C22|nr:TRAP transporter small permease subunit [Fluviibacterium sp. MJW13]
MPKALQLYVRIIDRISDYVGIVAMYLIFAMIGILLMDAITRNVLEIPVHWGIEAAQFTLAAYYFMGGAKTMKEGDHVRMDLLYDRLSERGKHRLDAITAACLLFYLVVLFIGSISSLEYAIQTDERRFSMWNPSMIPIKTLMVGCIALMILQTVSEFFKHIAALRGEVLS